MPRLRTSPTILASAEWPDFTPIAFFTNQPNCTPRPPNSAIPVAHRVETSLIVQPKKMWPGTVSLPSDLAITAWPDVTTTVCCNACRNSTNCTPRPPNPATTETSRLSCFRIVDPNRECLGCVLLQRFSRARNGPISPQVRPSKPAQLVLPGHQIQQYLLHIDVKTSLIVQPKKMWPGTVLLPSVSPSRPGPMSRQLCASMPAETRPIVLPGRQIQPQLKSSRLYCFLNADSNKECLGCILLQRFSRARNGPISHQLCSSQPAQSQPTVLPGHQIQQYLINLVVKTS